MNSTRGNSVVEIPERLAILPLKNKVLLPGAILRLRCTSSSSIRLVEQELWQKEGSPVIGVIPVSDDVATSENRNPLNLPLLPPLGSAETSTGVVGSGGVPGGRPADFQQPVGKLLQENFLWHLRGVAARALHVARSVEQPGGRVLYTVILEGLCRISLLNLNSRGPFHTARVLQLDMTKSEVEEGNSTPELCHLAVQLKAAASDLIDALEMRERRVGGVRALLQTLPAHRVADLLLASVDTSAEERLLLLDAVALKDRLITGRQLIRAHLERLEKASKKPTETKSADDGKALSAGQQVRPQNEEGTGGRNVAVSDDDDDVAALEARLVAGGIPPPVWKHVQREIRRLRKMQSTSPGYGSARQYLELLADLPWQVSSTELDIDLAEAKARLDREHFGLNKVKKRIIEYIAVRKLKVDATGPVLCFVGPPGVGKTSLASAIASALGRRYVRIALGGTKDEADIRGHRRTYVASMPGRLIEGIKRAGVNNPVMLLDEIDKTGGDTRGDPAAALLEVLDPEQNQHFTDHYLNVPFDLSKVVFVATANRSAPIPAPLLDRMEVIDLPGYTPEEKQRIALRHLIPRTLIEHGITRRHLEIPDHVVEYLIQRYTREAGVRNLARHLAALARTAAVRVAELQHSQKLTRQLSPPVSATSVLGSGGDGLEMEMEIEALGMQGKVVAEAMAESKPMVVDEALLETVLGPPRFDGKEAAERVATPGVAVGLVWTAVGGEVQFVEATMMLGKGDLHLTGQLGEVIKESAQIALTWVRARAADLATLAGDSSRGKDESKNLMLNRDVHIHFPAGATPKDGPSAGVTLVTALVSLLTQRCVRADTAMTGEITLRGLCLPVGGVKEKILAAHRCGIRRVILPEKNLKDLVEVPAAILASMEILPTKRVEEVLHEAFEGGCPTSFSRL